jgi:small multidrug resistance pump
MSPLTLLALAIAFETLWASMLKPAQGFRVLGASVVMVLAYGLSLIFLTLACKRLDISVAYAVWTGSGVALVATIGVFAFDERLDGARIVGLLLVVCGVLVLLGSERNLG